MLFPLTDTVHEILPALPQELLDDRARRRIEQVTEQLPAALTEQMHYECRLGSSGRVDLLVRIDGHGASLVDGRRGSIFSTRPFVGISRLCRRWQVDARLAAAVTALWLEFDLERDLPAGRMPTTRLFVELLHSWRDPAPEVAAVMDAVFSHLELPPAGAALRATLDALPDSSRLLAVGCEPASASALPRICSWLPDRHDFGRFVGRLRGAEEGDRASQALVSLDGPAVPLVAHVDGRERVEPGLGVELTFERAAQLRGEFPERPFLERLVAAGRCSAGKAAALTRWPGIDVAWLRHHLWPVAVIRRINHVKLRIEEGLVVEAKVYLSAHHRFHRGLLRSPRPLTGRLIPPPGNGPLKAPPARRERR
jgi:hypothetical protein